MKYSIFRANLQKNIHFIIIFRIFVFVKIHIFNPENDMALADGTPGYTPPANIRAYRKANRHLPEAWASPGDIVWDGESSLADLFLQKVSDTILKKIEICPWGWSKAIVHQMEMAGVPRNRMPSDEWLDRLRTLSNRVSTVKVQRQLGVEAYVCHTLSELFTLHPSLFTNGRAVLKSPWSSSGKGLMFLDNPNWQGWAKRILKLQGAVIVERLLDRQQDFAMEFYMREGRAEYLGLSIFNTDDHGHYINNVKASEEEKLQLLVSLNPEIPKSLDSTRDWYLGNLPLIAPFYTGPVGVDMLITKDGYLCPCIEINWRMTMGMVALKQ